jgi:hypothetical protein
MGTLLVYGKTLKLESPFNVNKQEVMALIGNVNLAFAVINPCQEAILYKFVLTRISGEPRTAAAETSKSGQILKSFCKTPT